MAAKSGTVHCFLWSVMLLTLVASGARAQTPAELIALNECLANAPGDRTDGEPRVFYVPQADTELKTIQLIIWIRVGAEVRYAKECAGVKGIVLRGTPEQKRLFEWLINQVFEPPARQAPSPVPDVGRDDPNHSYFSTGPPGHFARSRRTDEYHPD
jgi:hypothetical protein